MFDQSFKALVKAGCITVICLVAPLGQSFAPANAQDGVKACVTCLQPEAVYSCEVLPPETGAMAVTPALFCAGEMAQTNGHASCVVARSTAGAACSGQAVTLAYTGPVTEFTAEPVEDAAAVKPETKGEKPPKTLVEATGRAVTSTGEQIKKAGDAVSNAGKVVTDATKKTGNTVTDAAKSTWDCVVSLFQSC